MGSDGQFDGVIVTGCTILPAVDADGVIGDDAEFLRSALSKVHEALRPCGPVLAMQFLRLLKARTKARSLDQADEAISAAAYADWLANYPADVAQESCEYWARGNTWWPSWAELQAILDRRAAPRLAIRKALQKATDPKPAPLYLGEHLPETREQRLKASIASYLRHGKPFRAARIERELAAEENREPEEWAKETQEPLPTHVEAPPFAPGNGPSDKRAAQLAKEFHAQQATANPDGAA
jgi:hypothetical protein